MSTYLTIILNLTYRLKIRQYLSIGLKNKNFFIDFQTYFSCRWDFTCDTQMSRHMKHNNAEIFNIKLIKVVFVCDSL